MAKRFDLKAAIAYNERRNLTPEQLARLGLAFQILADLDKDGKIGPDTLGHTDRIVDAYLGVDRLAPPPEAPLCSFADAVYPLLTPHGAKWVETNAFGVEHGGPNHNDASHAGIDLCRWIAGRWWAQLTDKIVSILPGVVVDVYEPRERRRHYWMLAIAHNVSGRLWYSTYLHNDQHHRQVGDVVGAGELVANVGSTGTRIPHLHFGLHDQRKSDRPFVAASRNFHEHWLWAYETCVNPGTKTIRQSDGAYMHDGEYCDRWRRLAA